MTPFEPESATVEALLEPFSEQALRQMLDHSTADAFCVKDLQQRYLFCNPQMATLLGVGVTAVVGRTDDELLVHSSTRKEAERRVLASGVAEKVACEVRTRSQSGWFDINIIPLRLNGASTINGCGQWLHDVTEAHLERGLSQGQSRILQRIATGSELESVLLDITRLVEELLPEAMCSVFIRDKASNTLRPGPAPSLPQEYVQLFLEVPIEEGYGSCGTAAFRGETVLACDIEHDPLWTAFAATALQFQLRSCWSVPIFATTHQHLPNQVLGSFAIYGHSPAVPRPEQLQVLQAAAYLAGIALDIAEQRQSERARLETAQLLNAVASGASDAIFVKDLQGKYLFFNQAAAEFVGKPIESVIGQDDSTLFDPPSLELLRKTDRQVIETNEPRATEETLTASGVTRTYLVLKAPYRDEHGHAIGLIGISRDITERKQAEKALIASEERYRMAVLATHDFIWDIDLINTRATWSDRYEQVFGRTQDTSHSWQWWIDHLHPDDRERTIACFENAIAEGQHFVSCEYRLRRKDESWADVNDRAYIARNEQGVAYRMVGAMSDVTEQKQSERQKLKLFRVIDQSKDFISLADVSGRVNFMNAGARQMIGVDVDAEVTHLHLSDFVAPAYKDCFWNELMPQVLDRGLWEGEMQFIHLTSGQLIDVHRTTFLIHDEYGLPCIAGVTRDITAAKRAEKELRASQQTVQAVLAASPLTIYVLDLSQGQFQFATWQLLVDLGFADSPRVQWSWQAYQALIHPEDLPQLLQVLDRCQNAPDTDVSECEYRIRDSGGHWRWIIGRHVAFSQSVDDSRHQIIGTAQDVTARKELEHQVREAQKADAIGRLAGGVAHDFNNLLTIINGQTDLLLSKLHPEHAMHLGLKEVRDAGQRAAQLTRQLLSFGRKALVHPQILDLSATILGSAQLIRRFLGEHISLDLQLQATNAFVVADSSQMDQLILNLVVNARDAMPSGGVLTIATKRVNRDVIDVLNIPNASEGEYVEIIVRDTGTGMPAEVLDRVFEPFFTTKPTGQGTGLGLAVVHGIVKQTGGHIAIQSRLNQGTEFTIWLPATHDRPAESGPLDRFKLTVSVMDQFSDLKTVLIVEDEPGVRRLLRSALESEGYRLLEACDPEDAQQLIDQYGAPIDLLVTDVVMPRESGWALASKLRARWSALPVLYITGYSAELPPTFVPQSVYDQLLQKPFSPDDLRTAVAELLQASAPRRAPD